ncbi:class A beta-lactamase [Sinorhizobium sp. BG8]|uniref:class A beta-lactamase n=1 Tax=Sinorhizobium sp. BG8 TaxID=2613773 RepID=UPI00193D040A|nr:class A beta-lactamase [Sinorhizobium sp. BG8]QRM54673.1 class A beta-lactamase [Sinorhizobium sp. BG8]
MRAHLNRRAVLVASASAASAALFPGFPQASEAGEDITRRLGELEKLTGGRLGVAVRAFDGDAGFGHRESERFAMCSTFKALAAACVLKRADEGKERLDRRIVYGNGALVPYSPITEKFAGKEGMTLEGICEAAITLSDNTAGNLLLDVIGGPAALTQWLRETGDAETRLDRIEPDLNEAKKGDPRDTTTPQAMLATLGRLALGDVLSESSRQRLVDWMVETRTGDARLRAGLPKDWRAGDKTGTSATGAASDIAIAWPPGRGPVVIAVYIAEATAPVKELNPVFAEVGALIGSFTL